MMNPYGKKLAVAPAIIGSDHRIDPSVVIGYIPGREIELRPTIIGESCIIRSGSVVYASVIIGSGLQTGHNVIIREENRIGDNFCIWSNSIADYGCVIGNNVTVHNNVYICQYTTIEDDVFVGPGVITANDRYPVQKNKLIGPVFKRGARLGANVTVLPGVTIGENSLIGSGSVVTRDIPANCIAYGVPARVGRRIS